MIGLSFKDFALLTPFEFSEVCNAWHEWREDETRGAWERQRWLGCVSIQPHIKNRITPQELMPLPWDKQSKPNTPKSETLTHEQHLERIRELNKRLEC